MCSPDFNSPRHGKLVLVLLLSAAGLPLRASPGETNILTWKDGAQGAYSFTFDDGATGQFQHAVPALNARHMRGTFFLVGASVEAWYSTFGRFHVREVLAAIAAGHEIGSHTYSHPRLTELTDADIHMQMQRNRDYFRQWGIDLVSMAYPHSTTDARVQSIVGRYVEFARSGYPMKNNSASWTEITPLDLRWSSRDADHRPCVDLAVATGTWAISVFHEVGVSGKSPTAEEFCSLADYVARLRDEGKLWVDTLTAVACYIRERSVASLKPRYDSSANTITVMLTVGLGHPYVKPLTLRTTIDERDVRSVDQAGMPIPYRVLQVGVNRWVQYDVIPDAGPVTVVLAERESNR